MSVTGIHQSYYRRCPTAWQISQEFYSALQQEDVNTFTNASEEAVEFCDERFVLGWLRYDTSEAASGFDTTSLQCTTQLVTAEFNITVDEDGWTCWSASSCMPGSGEYCFPGCHPRLDLPSHTLREVGLSGCTLEPRNSPAGETYSSGKYLGMDGKAHMGIELDPYVIALDHKPISDGSSGTV